MTPNYSAGLTGMKRARNRRYHVVHRRGGCREIPFPTGTTPKKFALGKWSRRRSGQATRARLAPALRPYLDSAT